MAGTASLQDGHAVDLRERGGSLLPTPPADFRVDEFSWAVGLFEGEGTGQDLDVVDRFAAAVGVRHVYGPYQSRDRKYDGGLRKPFLYWVVEGGEARLLGVRMAPWLGERHGRASYFT